MRVERRGFSLGMVLMLTAVAFAAVSVLVGSGLFHLYYASLSYEESTARSLAEAGISKALAAVASASDPLHANYGTAGAPGGDTMLTVAPDWAPEGSSGTVCFNVSVAQHHGLAWSTNNVMGTASVDGWNHEPVPKGVLHLVGTGVCRHTRRSVEAFFYAPPFPYSIGSNGPVVSDGYLMVGALSEGKVYSLHASPSRDDLIPGHMASNSDDDQSVKLGPQSYVAGNLRSAGGIVLDPLATVSGTSTPYAGSTSIPDLSPSSFDPAITRQSYQNIGSQLTSPSLDGVYRANGDVTVYGDLTLNGGVLYVPGNLTVLGGGVVGKGAVISGGNLSLDKGASFSADNQVALVSQGDMTLKGSGTDRSFIQGIMFSRGAVQTSDITLMGSLVKAGDGSASVNVSNSHVVQVPEYTSLSVDGPPPATPPPPRPSNWRITNASQSYELDNAMQSARVTISGPSDARAFYNAATDTYDASGLSYANLTVQLDHALHGHPPTHQVLSGMNGLLLAEHHPFDAVLARNHVSSRDVADAILANIQAAVSNYNDQYQALKNGGTGVSTIPANRLFSFDLNEFLTFGERLRLLLWREI